MNPLDTLSDRRLRRRLPPFAVLFCLSLGIVCPELAARVSGDDPASPAGLTIRLHDVVTEAFPPLPDPGVFPVQLVLDDDGAEGSFGLTSSNARQFLFFNRFDNPGSFHLEEIWVLFPAGTDIPVGGEIELIVMLDADGDPTNGATLLATFDETIQVADGSTFSVYPIAPIPINEPGDILIGVINRYFRTGIDPPPTLPASLDTTSSQGRSYFALWTVDPPEPPDLATASVVAVLDGSLAGNFMIRGFGAGSPALEIPTLSPTAMSLAGLLLLALGIARIRRLRSAGGR